MIKQVFAIIKSVLLITGGIIALLGVRYFMMTMNVLTAPLNVLFQLLINTVLVIGALAILCNWYLRDEPKEKK